MLRDLQFALRLWRKTPSVFLLALVALGLGIGATTAVFSVVRAVLLKPLPYPAPDEHRRTVENAARHARRAGSDDDHGPGHERCRRGVPRGAQG